MLPTPQKIGRRPVLGCVLALLGIGALVGVQLLPGMGTNSALNVLLIPLPAL
jgi:hypothetical protein